MYVFVHVCLHRHLRWSPTPILPLSPRPPHAPRQALPLLACMPLMEPSWAQRGSKLSQLGANLAQLGLKFSQVSQLESTWR